MNKPDSDPTVEIGMSEEAFSRLYGHIYDELQLLARLQRKKWQGDSTMNTTALVHEAYLKLKGHHNRFRNRNHFLAVASRAMRQVLVSYAEKKSAEKRGGERTQVTLNEELAGTSHGEGAIDALAVTNALTALEQMDTRATRVVECRFLGGMSVEETADALQISPATVHRDWRTARAWLRARFIEPGNSSMAAP